MTSDDETDLPHPQYRVTLAQGELLFADWAPWLTRRYGPLHQLLDRPGIEPMADLAIMRDEADRRELIVTELGRRADGRLRATLVGWATLLGYERAWCADDIDPTASGAYVAMVTGPAAAL